MKFPTLPGFLICLIIFSCNTEPRNTGSNDNEEEWIPLFNKKDLTGWDVKIAKHDLNDNFNNTFLVKDSILKVDYSGYPKFDGQFGHLYYKEPFSYYKIRIEYRFTGKQMADGPDYAYLNSGVMLHSQSAASMGHEQTFPVSLEMQFLANNDSLKRATGNLCTPGTEVSMNGNIVHDHCINSSSANYPADKWVTAEAVVLGDSIIHHIIEGDTVLTYHKSHIGGGFVNNNFAWSRGGFGADSTDWITKNGVALASGYIALQAESHPVEFRKVELLNLVGCTDENAINHKHYYLKTDNSKCKYK
jgi:hypothetical protein